MVKKKNDKGELIFYQNDYYIEESDFPNRIIGRLKKEDIDKLFKTQELVAVIEGLGNENNDNIVDIKKGKRLRVTLEVIEDEEE